MATDTFAKKKRKNIDIQDDTFRALSVLAAANGKNLKSYIETLLDNEAKMLREEFIYQEFLKEPDSQEIISSDDKEAFENWLGV